MVECLENQYLITPDKESLFLPNYFITDIKAAFAHNDYITLYTFTCVLKLK